MPAKPTREDSGLIDLDALLREAHESGPIPHADESGERLVVRPAPAREREETPEREEKPAPPPPSAPSAEPAPASAPVRASATLPPPPAKRGVLPVAGAMVLALALATGALFWSTRRPSSVAVTPIPAATIEPAAPATPVTASPAPAEVATGVSDLPSVDPATATSVASSAAPPAIAHVRAHASARPEAAVAVSDVTTDAPPSAAGDLGRAMHDAVGVREDLRKQETNHAGSSGARQLRPSPGAVVGAINAVLPAARACLGPDDPVRSGVLVFSSEGTVARVELRGQRPQDECIRAAMAGARIEPFVDETFSTRITVRP